MKSGTTIATSAYVYDNLGRKTSDTGSGYATSYGYDNAGQLTSETRTGTSAYSISYTYDNAGNRATKVLGGTTENYSYDDANKLTAAGGKSYTYDNAGNTTGVSWSGGSISLSWDAESRLKSETTGSTTVNYVFNGLGQRVQKTGGASATYVLGDDSIDSEVLSDGSAIYAHGAAGLISESRSGTSKFYHTDALGSVRALTNGSGSVTDSRSTDAFGLVVTTSGSTPTPFGFAGNHGYQQDDETGLMRLGHRMYDASTGRFISRDPIQDGYNWYVYCENDPVQKIDSGGLWPAWVGDALIALGKKIVEIGEHLKLPRPPKEPKLPKPREPKLPKVPVDPMAPRPNEPGYVPSPGETVHSPDGSTFGHGQGDGKTPNSGFWDRVPENLESGAQQVVGAFDPTPVGAGDSFRTRD